MGTRHNGVDAYIAKSAEFAKPILEHIRELIHKTVPEVEEKIKWGMPSFEYKGPFIGIAAFKKHTALGFWKVSILREKGILPKPTDNASGSMVRIESMKDLPKTSTLVKWFKEAKKLNDEGVKVVRKEKPSHERKGYKMPGYFAKVLAKNKAAKKTFEDFSPSHKREYLEWIVEAKTEETRTRRMTKAIEMLTEGKSRHWKYQKK
jgi:uncharacterized protein YdeI (YjbR/CyaY-like superfamily)